ncbi:hypothetical protein AB4K20DRAFT_1882808 [Rhizopus microsporus]
MTEQFLFFLYYCCEENHHICNHPPLSLLIIVFFLPFRLCYKSSYIYVYTIDFYIYKKKSDMRIIIYSDLFTFNLNTLYITTTTIIIIWNI